MPFFICRGLFGQKKVSGIAGEINFHPSVGPGRAARFIRQVLAPGPVSMRTFAILIAIACLLFGLIIGLSVGITTGELLSQLGSTIGLVAAGLAIGLGSVFLSSRLIPRPICASPSLAAAVAASYFVYIAGAAVGAGFTLSLRLVLPLGYSPLGLGLNVIVVLTACLVWVLVGMIAHRLQARDDRISAQVSELEESRRRIIAIQEQAHKRMAAYLHGPVQTKLLVLGRDLESCQRLVKTDPGKAARVLAEVRGELDALREKDLRTISRELYPSIIDIGLPAALRSLRDQFEGLVAIDLEIEGKITSLEGPAQHALAQDARLTLYRCAQEILNNVVRHSQASQVKVRLWKSDDNRINMSIEDNGVGFVPGGVRPSLGLAIMQDYVAALTGALHIETSPGQGTKVVIGIPIGSAPGSRFRAHRDSLP